MLLRYYAMEPDLVLNKNILKNLRNMGDERKKFFKLEDLVTNYKVLKSFLEFLNLAGLKSETAAEQITTSDDL